MSLARKFILILISSILFIAFVNIASFYFFYNSYLKIYLAEKIRARDNVTIEYINQIIEKQTIDEIDNIFSDIEIEFFELLENNQ
jgi:capsular polysaccharide biosynthesis protein